MALTVTEEKKKPVVEDVAPPIDIFAPEAPTTNEDIVPQIVAQAASEGNTKPVLAEQGPGNRVLKALSRMSGATADSPTPGELYSGPTTPEAKSSKVNNWLSKLGDTFTETGAAFGRPEEQEYADTLPQKKRELTATTGRRKAQIDAMSSYHTGQLENQADKIDVQRQGQQNTMRLKGYVDDGSGAYRPMNEDEILADPILSRNRDLSAAALDSKNAQTNLAMARRDALMNPNNPTLQLKAKQIEAQLKMAQANLALRQHALARQDALGGFSAMMNFGMNPLTGETLGDAQARGAAPRTLADAAGNPVPYRQMSVFSPTQQMKNVAAQSSVAAEGIPNVIKEVDDLGDLMGPISGRWNDFMQGRVGMDNPAFAGLRADMLMLSSAVALAHARGRLPENLREEFDSMINAPQQSPDNIKVTLQHILPWMQQSASMPSQPVPVPPMTDGGKGAPATADTGGDEYVRGADGKLHKKGVQ